MAQIDAFQGAEGSADAQKRALLSAIAAQGSAGQEAYNAQQSAAAQAAQQAVQGAAQRAGAIGAPDALAGQLAASGQAVGNTYGADASAGASTLAAATAASQQANGNYMDQLQAAIPLSRQLSEAYQKDSERQAAQKLWDDTIARNQNLEDRAFTVGQQKQQADYATQQHQWDLENHQAALALAQQKAANSTSSDPLAALVHHLGGQTLAKTQLNAVVQAAIKDASVRHHTEPFPMADTNVALSDADKQSVVDSVGGQLGLEPGMLAAFLAPKPAAPTKQSKTLSPQMTEQLRNKPRYSEYANKITAALDEAGRIKPPKGQRAPSVSAVKAKIASNTRKELAKEPLLADLLIRDYLRG